MKTYHLSLTPNLVTRLMFGMKAHLIDTHLIVPRPFAKIKVKYLGHRAVFWGIGVSQTHLVSLMKIWESSPKGKRTLGKGETACYEQFILFPQCFQKTCTADT